MKAILKFDLNDEDDSFCYKRAIRFNDMAGAISDIRQLSRSLLKYEESSSYMIKLETQEQYDLAEKILNAIYEILKEYNVNDLD
jgi:hypothetical protein